METFGTYIRDCRTKAGLSLRRVADALDVSHVYLGDIERGASRPRKTLPRKYWPRLLEVVPTVKLEELDRLATASRPVAMNVADRPPDIQKAVFALARRVEDRSLSDDEIRAILGSLKQR